MEQRRLGECSLSVAPIAFGGDVFGWTIDEPTSFALLDAFVDARHTHSHKPELCPLLLARQRSRGALCSYTGLSRRKHMTNPRLSGEAAAG
jgi:hypothetical protein